MSLDKKSFKNLRNGEILTVNQNFKDICIMADGTKMNASTLLDTSLFSEMVSLNESNSVDVISNTNSNVITMNHDSVESNMGSYANDLLSSLRSVDTSRISDNVNSTVGARIIEPVTNDSRGSDISNSDVLVTGESERDYLMKKYNLNDNGLSNNTPVSEVIRDRDEDIVAIQSKNEMNPIKVMFSGAKRIIDVNIDISISDKIPRIDFIEMMEDTYETSIIEFLVEDIFEKTMANPELVKNAIRDSIEALVYPKSKTKAVVESKNSPKTTTRKTTPRKTSATTKKAVNVDSEVVTDAKNTTKNKAKSDS